MREDWTAVQNDFCVEVFITQYSIMETLKCRSGRSPVDRVSKN